MITILDSNLDQKDIENKTFNATRFGKLSGRHMKNVFGFLEIDKVA
jgi:hypothetical protein